jgi:SagB-type dehydrogenase family enzyme
MKKITLVLAGLSFVAAVFAQTSKNISLLPPQTEQGMPVMKALSLRYSERQFDSAQFKIQDLSNLLWATNGISRTESGKRTAPSSMNSQDVDVYVCLKSGLYFYNAAKNELEFITDGDHRALVASRQAEMAVAPVFILLTSDISRFKPNVTDSAKVVWGSMDVGIVSQNISLFCASMGFSTVPRGTMDNEKLRQLLNLPKSRYLMLNHPVSYKKK